MSSEERKFERVLDSLAEKEKRAQRRATLLTVLTLAVGLLLMAILSYQIVRLRNTRTGLEQDVRNLKAEQAAATKKLDETRTEVEGKKKELDAMKKEYDEVVENVRAGNIAKALQIASTGIRRESVSQSTGAPGFVASNSFRGPSQTSITIEVIPDKALLESSTRPRTLFTYQITGEPTHDVTNSTSFSLSLDKSKEVVLIFDFAKEGPGGYTIKQTANTGKNKTEQFHIDPSETRIGRTISLKFSVE
jgi:hypothetical protein